MVGYGCGGGARAGQVTSTALTFIFDDPEIRALPVGDLPPFGADRGSERADDSADCHSCPKICPPFGKKLGRAGASIAGAAAICTGCATVARFAVNELDGLCRVRRRSLKGFAEIVGYSAVWWPTSQSDPFFNINSPQDLVNAEQLLSDRNLKSEPRAARDGWPIADGGCSTSASATPLGTRV